ncbi:hypothetical protein KKC13_04750 [bacterium]|nr:hypothetical protein [bacterium]MBU1958536.1 hypothetical protein [bacterium]
MKHLLLAIALVILGGILLCWSAYNLWIAQYIYSGPTPVVMLLSIFLFIKAYREFMLYKNQG